MVLLALGLACGALLAAFCAYKSQMPEAEDENGPLRTATLHRLRLRARLQRKLLEAAVTSTVGAAAEQFISARGLRTLGIHRLNQIHSSWTE